MSSNQDNPNPDDLREEEDFASLFAASETDDKQRKRIAVGDLVRGRVIALGQDSAFVAIGAKGEAVLALEEFRDADGVVKLAVGDTVEATVVDDGQRSGSIVLKHTLGRGSHLSAEIEQALNHHIAVEGIVVSENKGGFDVQLGSVRAFCPWSQIDLRRGAEKPLASQFIGQRFRFYVTKCESGGRNIVVSRRELLEEEAAHLAEQTWENLRVGAVITGTVTSLRDFGAFVDLGGVEGLIHISELGYGRVKHPSEVLTPGQTVEVQVVKLDPPNSEPGAPRRQIGLSLKALAADPWSNAAARFPVGATLTGTVRRLEAYGAFIELEPGLEGLVHISKLVLDRRVAHARQVLSVGQTVQVTVLGVDPQQRRVSLSMVERARQERDSGIAQDKRDEDAIIEQTNRRSSFGSLADLMTSNKSARSK